MENSPVMRASEEERVRTVSMSAGQRRMMRFMAAIQILMIGLTWGLLIAQIATSVKVGIGAAPTLIVFVVVYLHFTKHAMALADAGIRVRWIRAMRVWSPILYGIACVLCVCTLQ